MIALVVVFLCALYVLKIFFPAQFVMTIENKQLILIGSYIDNHWWLQEICDIVFSFIVYWFYLGATLRKWVLSWKELIAVFVTIAVTHGLYFWNPTLSSGIATIAMLCIPAIFGASMRDVAIVFSVHYLSQLLSTLIRGLPYLLTNVNYITIVLMTFECYFWLLLLYLCFNFKKGGKKNEERNNQI